MLALLTFLVLGELVCDNVGKLESPHFVKVRSGDTFAFQKSFVKRAVFELVKHFLENPLALGKRHTDFSGSRIKLSYLFEVLHQPSFNKVGFGGRSQAIQVSTHKRMFVGSHHVRALVIQVTSYTMKVTEAFCTTSVPAYVMSGKLRLRIEASSNLFQQPLPLGCVI